MELFSLWIILYRISVLLYKSENIFSSIYFQFLAWNKQVITSAQDLEANVRNLLNSGFVLSVAPSAMFREIESAALLNCNVNANNSSFGKLLVSIWTSSANFTAISHTFNFSKLNPIKVQSCCFQAVYEILILLSPAKTSIPTTLFIFSREFCSVLTVNR